MTIPTQLVLQLLLADPERDRYGFEIGQEAGLPSGTVHPILARLEAMRWVSSRWEDVDPAEAGRPARRYYRVTAEGESAARAALARAHRPALILRPFPLGGQP